MVWLTGHSRDAAVSEIIATYLIADGYTVYAYNFDTLNQVEVSLIDKNNKSNEEYGKYLNFDDIVETQFRAYYKKQK